MIDIDVSGNNYELNDKITEYVQEKIGNLEKYLPRNVRNGIKGSVTLTTDASGREDNQCVCEAKIPVKGTVIEAREATMNMFAAVDICAAKLKGQMVKYKTKNSPRQTRAKIFIAKLTRRYAEE